MSFFFRRRGIYPVFFAPLGLPSSGRTYHPAYAERTAFRLFHFLYGRSPCTAAHMTSFSPLGELPLSEVSRFVWQRVPLCEVSCPGLLCHAPPPAPGEMKNLAFLFRQWLPASGRAFPRRQRQDLPRLMLATLSGSSSFPPLGFSTGPFRFFLLDAEGETGAATARSGLTLLYLSLFFLLLLQTRPPCPLMRV